MEYTFSTENLIRNTNTKWSISSVNVFWVILAMIMHIITFKLKDTCKEYFKMMKDGED